MEGSFLLIASFRKRFVFYYRLYEALFLKGKNVYCIENFFYCTAVGIVYKVRKLTVGAKNKKLTKYQILQKNNPVGRIVAFLIGFIANFLPIPITQRLAMLFCIVVDLSIHRICVLTVECVKKSSS